MTAEDPLELELGTLRDQVVSFFRRPWEMPTDPLDYLAPIEDAVDAACQSESANEAANRRSDATADSLLAAVACTIGARAGTGIFDEVAYLLTSVGRDARRLYRAAPADQEAQVRQTLASVRAHPRDSHEQEMWFSTMSARLIVWATLVGEAGGMIA